MCHFRHDLAQFPGADDKMTPAVVKRFAEKLLADFSDKTLQPGIILRMGGPGRGGAVENER